MRLFRARAFMPLFFTLALFPAVPVSSEECTLVPFDSTLDTIVEHDDGAFLWFHPRAAVIPQAGKEGRPAVLVTLQKHLQISDFYSGLYAMRTDDLGKTWTDPTEIPELAWRDGPNGSILAVCDVTPAYHPIAGKVIAIGAQLYYRPDGSLLEKADRADQTAYSIYDPKTDKWTGWNVLEMPEDPKFNFARNACAQWLVESNGNLLLPLYFGVDAKQDFSVTVARCSFDGEKIAYQEHGTEMAVSGGRGLCEPSLIRFQDRYFLTLRNDARGYVSSSADGLHFDPIIPWCFDDGEELGSYNTQQHWLIHTDGLFLVYTRKGANNDHVFRNRAPLFIAQVNPDTLRVIRTTERVLIPERGATLGNFGATAIDEHESWVTVNEGVWNDDMRARGAKGALFAARIHWETPNVTVRFPYPSRPPLFSMMDVNVNEPVTATLPDGVQIPVEVLELTETRDPIRGAMRRADVRLKVNGDETVITSCLYNRPVAIGGALVDCPVTRGYTVDSNEDCWSLKKDVRLRFWPGGGPLTDPGTFLYPIDQVWQGSLTWFDNEPVDGGPKVSKPVYYHSGIDVGGVEGRTRVLAASDGLVVSARGDTLPGFTEDTPIKPRGDVIYLYDGRGWFYRYSHFHTIDDAIQPGAYIRKGAFLGLVGKEGASGGWSHIHFEIRCRQPSGGWGALPSQALIREAYIREHHPELLACARQRYLIMPGDTVTLDASHSWSATNEIVSYEWIFTNGETTSGVHVDRNYSQPGDYEEILKITDGAGNVDYDFAEVQVLDPEQPEQYMPSLHLAFDPSLNLKSGDPITFSVRAFGFEHGEEQWDFGDGSPEIRTHSGGNSDPHAGDGYTFLEHHYEKAGQYLVTVHRENVKGIPAFGHLHVRIEE